MAANNLAWMTLLIVALIAVRTFVRVRRSIGRQPLRPIRMSIRMAILLVASVAFLAFGFRHWEMLTAAAGGGAIGTGLAFYALKHTTMESTGAGIFYTGHPYIGLGVTLLVTLRIAYRLLQTGPATAQMPGGAAFAATVNNPLTVGAFFVAAGYYVLTYAALLRRSRALATPVTE